VRILCISIYVELHHRPPSDSHMMGNIKFTTFIVLFERESFIITGTVRYSSTTSIPPENIRLIYMLLVEKVVYNSLCLQATNHCPETSIAVFRRNFVRPHQRQSDTTSCKVLGKDNFRVLSTSINPQNSLRRSCWSCSVVFQR